jgi:hypothetical protein
VDPKDLKTLLMGRRIVGVDASSSGGPGDGVAATVRLKLDDGSALRGIGTFLHEAKRPRKAADPVARTAKLVEAVPRGAGVHSRLSLYRLSSQGVPVEKA